MANPEHLKILKQGVKDWNQWREDNPEVVPDLEGADLQGMNLQWVNFRKAKLRNVEFHGIMPVADLSESDLFETDFSGALLYNTKFEGAYLVGTDLRGAEIEFASITKATVLGVKYDNKMKCLGCNTEGSVGSQRFIRHIKDMDYIEETKEKHPVRYFIWSYTSDCGRSWGLLTVWCILIIGFFATLFDFAGESSSLVLSIIAFTSFGFGDIEARSMWGPFLFWVEVALGYVMFGALVALVSSQMARRS